MNRKFQKTICTEQFLPFFKFQFNYIPFKNTALMLYIISNDSVIFIYISINFHFLQSFATYCILN